MRRQHQLAAPAVVVRLVDDHGAAKRPRKGEHEELLHEVTGLFLWRDIFQETFQQVDNGAYLEILFLRSSWHDRQRQPCKIGSHMFVSVSDVSLGAQLESNGSKHRRGEMTRHQHVGSPEAQVGERR